MTQKTADHSAMEGFGRQLQHYRKRLGLSQSALAELSTVSVRAVRNLELGQVVAPRRETVRQLSRALKLTTRQQTEFELAAGIGVGEDSVPALSLPIGLGISPLHGRNAELAGLVRRIRSEKYRISTICGLPGVGKSHLALTVGMQLRSDGEVSVFWLPVQSEPLTNDHGVLAAHIGRRKTLLVIDGNDNGAVPPGALSALLQDCPRLTVLETRRFPNTPTENYHLFLGPLALPATGTCRSPAVEFLVELISDLHPGFCPSNSELAGLTEVCRQLDGHPAALQSAASWAAVVSLDEIFLMAREEPQILATHPGGLFDPVAAISEATARLGHFQRQILAHLVRSMRALTLDEIAALLAVSRLSAASGVQVLLQSGLLAELASHRSETKRFALLNLVREQLRTCSFAADSA